MNSWSDIENQLRARRLGNKTEPNAELFWSEFRARAPHLPRDVVSPEPLGFQSRPLWAAAALLLIALVSLPLLSRRLSRFPTDTTIQSLEILVPCTSTWILQLKSDSTPRESALLIWVSGLEDNPS